MILVVGGTGFIGKNFVCAWHKAGRSVREIADLMESVTGRSIAVQTVPARASDVDRVVLDTTRIRQELGWQPLLSLEKTIGEIWAAQGLQLC